MATVLVNPEGYFVAIVYAEANLAPGFTTLDVPDEIAQTLRSDYQIRDGEWVVPTIEVATNTEEIIADMVRAERAKRLSTTDWTQLPDIPEATRLKWQDYRQALRDITAQAGFPLNVTWPEPPA